MPTIQQLKQQAIGSAFKVSTYKSEIILADKHGTFTFCNDANGRKMASITLQKMEAARRNKESGFVMPVDDDYAEDEGEW